MSDEEQLAGLIEQIETLDLEPAVLEQAGLRLLNLARQRASCEATAVLSNPDLLALLFTRMSNISISAARKVCHSWREIADDEIARLRTLRLQDALRLPIDGSTDKAYLGLVALPGNELCISDQTGNRLILLKVQRGQVLQRHIGRRGLGPGEFEGPRALATDGAGAVFVVDHGNARVQKIATRTGRPLRCTSTHAIHPQYSNRGLGAIAFHTELQQLFLVNSYTREVSVYDASLGLQRVFSTPQGSRPWGVAVSIDRLYIADMQLGCIYAFSLGGELLQTFGKGVVFEAIHLIVIHERLVTNDIDAAFSMDNGAAFVAFSLDGRLMQTISEHSEDGDQIGGRWMQAVARSHDGRHLMGLMSRWIGDDDESDERDGEGRILRIWGPPEAITQPEVTDSLKVEPLQSLLSSL